MHLLQITLFIVVLAAASAHIGGEAPRQELTQNYCGRNLAKALAMICDDVKPFKRSNAGMYCELYTFLLKNSVFMITGAAAAVL